MPDFEYECLECGLEFEDLILPGFAEPNECPECQGEIKKLISLVAKGRVELTGHELKQQIKADAEKLKSAAGKNENVLADLVGPDKLQANKVLESKIKSERPKIKTSRKKSQ